MGVVDDIFRRSEPGNAIAVYGILLAAAVTAGVSVQAFAHETMGFPASGAAHELRQLVFGFHLATVAAVVVETGSGFRGKRQFWSHLVIGSGIVATFSQTAVVATTVSGAQTGGFAWAFALLAIQSYANALMVALLVAEAWASAGRLADSATVSLLNSAM